MIKAYTILVRRKFKSLKGSISPFVDITNPQFISVGSGTTIRQYSWLYAITDDQTGNRFTPDLIIGKNCSIGRFCHITCSGKVVLEDDVFLTEGVLITDSIHGYKDISTPIIKQPLISKSPLRIGHGTWIGNGARIVGQVDIGNNCVIAANSVVSNTTIPDYSLVMGIPGKVVKKYNPGTESWEEVI